MLALADGLSRRHRAVNYGALLASTNGFSETTTNFTFNSAHDGDKKILNATRLFGSWAIVRNWGLIFD